MDRKRFRRRAGARGGPPDARLVRARPSNDDDCLDDEAPVREVTITRPFALSVQEVTFADYDRFTHPNKVADAGWGRSTPPLRFGQCLRSA